MRVLSRELKSTKIELSAASRLLTCTGHELRYAEVIVLITATAVVNSWGETYGPDAECSSKVNIYVPLNRRGVT